jgi:hypothetical protein
MEMVWKRSRAYLLADKMNVACSCVVRNEENGQRKPWEVVHGERRDGSEGPPYQPRMFPIGRWKITGIFPRGSDYLRPFFIATDAHQQLPVWRVTEGHYLEKTDELFEDWGYGLHCSTSQSTLGCIRIANVALLTRMIDAINEAGARGEESWLTVED